MVLSSLDPIDTDYARIEGASIFISFFLTDEMEGDLLFNFGDIALGAKVLDAFRTMKSIDSENYYFEKQADKGRMSYDAATTLSSNYPEGVEELVNEYGDRLHAALTVTRAKYGCPYEGECWDFIGEKHYQKVKAEKGGE